MKNKLLLSLLAFLLGIALHQHFGITPPTWLPWTLLFSLLFFHLLQIFQIPKFPKLLTILTLITFFTFALLRSQHTTHIPSPQTVDFYSSEEKNSITLIGTIAEEPDIRRDKINYTIQVSHLEKPKNEHCKIAEGSDGPLSGRKKCEIENWNEVTGKTLISSSKYPAYSYNDTIKITGHLQQPSIIEDFDYPGYLSRFGIYSVMYRPKISLMNMEALKSHQPSAIRHKLSTLNPRQHWPLFYQTLLKLKQNFESHMNRTFSSEPSASFMAGLLLGSRKGLPEDLSEDFRITGLTHIIAISGYNITLIVTLLMAFFKPLGRKLSMALSAVGIILFTLFVGASPAVVRACIMGLIGLLALHSDRKGDITLTLCLTASLMIGYNPKILFHDVGFQLSFLATMGLIYVSPLLEPYFKWLPDKLAIRESILLTLSAQIMALPIILFNFQNLSIVSPLSNLLIAGPILPLAMLFGFVGTITSFLSLTIAKFIAYPGYLLLQYVTAMTQFTAQIPYASISINWFNEGLFLIYFALLSISLLIFWKKRQEREQRITWLQLDIQAEILHRTLIQA